MTRDEAQVRLLQHGFSSSDIDSDCKSLGIAQRLCDAQQKILASRQAEVTRAEDRLVELREIARAFITGAEKELEQIREGLK